ncbi:hypothetical protein D3C71_1539150 [compost metagenome]
MSKAAGQLAHSLHFLRLAQRLLRLEEFCCTLGNPMLQVVVQNLQHGDRPVALRLDGTAIVNIDEHTGKTKRLPIGIAIDTTVRFDPVEIAVLTPNAILVGVMPSPFDCIIDGGDEPIAIFRVNRGNDLVQGNAAATQCRIETKTIREGRINGELVRRNIPDPGADDRPGAQRQLDTLGVNDL